jgi:hypothetical protein
MVSIDRIPGVSRHTVICFAALLALLVLLGGCGGGETPEGDDTADQTAPEATATVATAADGEGDTVPTVSDDEEPTAPTDTDTDTDTDTTATDTDATATPIPSADEDEDTAATTTTATEDETTPPADEDEDTASEEVTNAAGGIAFQVPTDWHVVTNEGLPGMGGFIALAPEGSTIDNTETLIIMTVGNLELVLEATTPDAELDDFSLDQLLDQMLDEENNLLISDKEDITVGDMDAVAADISGNDPEMGEMEGRIVLAQVGDERLLQLVSLAPEGRWDPEPTDMVLESISFFEPTEANLNLDDIPLPDTEDVVPSAPTITGGNGSDIDVIFPLPASAEEVMSMGSDSSLPQVNYQTSLSLDEVMEFYREELLAAGAVEREILTVTSDGTFSMVFDNWPAAEGLSVVIQGVELNSDMTNVNIRLEEV